jgi:arabinose-5-phosphate isomerase
MGDALAVALLECRGFTAGDFARYHPGGALGKRLYLRVADLYINNEKPMVLPETGIREIILEITSRRLGCTAVVENGILEGIITDGDLRRMLQGSTDVSSLKATDILSRHPLTVTSDALVSDALDLMRSRNITQLLVVDNEKYMGVIHLHDILKEGII